jgi:hypothetical protein
MATIRNSYEIGSKSGPNPSEGVLLMQRQRSIDCDHCEELFRRNPRFSALKRAHFGELTQALVAGETIGAQANIEPKSTQFFKVKAAVPKIIVTSRAMHNMKLVC